MLSQLTNLLGFLAQASQSDTSQEKNAGREDFSDVFSTVDPSVGEEAGHPSQSFPKQDAASGEVGDGGLVQSAKNTGSDANDAETNLRTKGEQDEGLPNRQAPAVTVEDARLSAETPAHIMAERVQKNLQADVRSTPEFRAEGVENRVQFQAERAGDDGAKASVSALGGERFFGTSSVGNKEGARGTAKSMAPEGTGDRQTLAPLGSETGSVARSLTLPREGVALGQSESPFAKADHMVAGFGPAEDTILTGPAQNRLGFPLSGGLHQALTQHATHGAETLKAQVQSGDMGFGQITSSFPPETSEERALNHPVTPDGSQGLSAKAKSDPSRDALVPENALVTKVPRFSTGNASEPGVMHRLTVSTDTAATNSVSVQNNAGARPETLPGTAQHDNAPTHFDKAPVGLPSGVSPAPSLQGGRKSTEIQGYRGLPIFQARELGPHVPPGPSALAKASGSENHAREMTVEVFRATEAVVSNTDSVRTPSVAKSSAERAAPLVPLAALTPMSAEDQSDLTKTVPMDARVLHHTSGGPVSDASLAIGARSADPRLSATQSTDDGAREVSRPHVASGDTSELGVRATSAHLGSAAGQTSVPSAGIAGAPVPNTAASHFRRHDDVTRRDVDATAVVASSSERQPTAGVMLARDSAAPVVTFSGQGAAMNQPASLVAARKGVFGSGVISPSIMEGAEEEAAIEFSGAVTQDARGTSLQVTQTQSALAQRTDPAMVVRQVTEAAARMGEGMVELRLSPEELGQVRMQMIAGEGGLTVHITADRPETLDLLRRHVDQLARDLAEQGFDSAGFTFADDRPDGRAASRRNDPDDPQMSQDITPQSGAAPQLADGLDIRI